MTLSEIAIRRPVFTWMLMIGLILFGHLSFREMGIGLMPDVDFPMVSVKVTLEGAHPLVMEKEVVDPIESALLSIQGITNISSSAKSGQAEVTVEFDLDKEIDVAVAEVQTKLSQVTKKLPEDIAPPVVSKMNPEDRPILWLSVRSDEMSKQELMAFVNELQYQVWPISCLEDMSLPA